MQKREKILFIATVICVAVFAIMKMGLEEKLDTLLAGNSDTVALQKKFESDLDQVKEIYNIEKEFLAIGRFPLDNDNNYRPAYAFADQVQKMCEDSGFPAPPIRPEMEEIEGVDKYELINVTVKTEGSFNDTVKLLKTFDSNGLMIREVTLSSPRNREVVDATVKVSRIAETRQ